MRLPTTRSVLGWGLSAALIGATGAPGLAAEALQLSASVDKTTVAVGESIQLTLTVSGDLEGLELPAFGFPEGWVVQARSQRTNVSVRAGQVERALSLTYVLVAQEAGTFALGPFELEYEGEIVPTEPIEITVERPAVPPELESGERSTI